VRPAIIAQCDCGPDHDQIGDSSKHNLITPELLVTCCRQMSRAVGMPIRNPEARPRSLIYALLITWY
jgi:hypothetical protein